MHRALEAAGRFREALAAIEHAGGAAPYRDGVVDELATDRGRLLWRNARFDEAERVLAAAYADRCRRLGEDHPDTLETLERLAANAGYQLRNDDATERFEVVIARLEGTLGKRHLRTGIAKRNYAAFLRQTDAEAAWELLAQATRTIARHCKRDSPEAVATLKVETLLQVCVGRGDVAVCRATVDLASTVHGASHALTASAMLTLAAAELAAARPEVARAVAQRAAALLEDAYGSRHPLVGIALDHQARALAAEREVDGALAMMRAAALVYGVTYPGALVGAWGDVMNLLYEHGRVEDIRTEVEHALARPLSAEWRAYVVRFQRAIT